MRYVKVFCLLALLPVSIRVALAEYRDKPLEVSRADRERAIRERPGIFGMGVFWDGESDHADEYNALMKRRCIDAGVRMTRFGFDWCNLEPEPGVYKWDEADTIKGLDKVLDTGLEVLGLICTHPTWAGDSSLPLIHCPYEKASGYFVEFCKNLAARYKDTVQYWEFWNEPDVTGWLAVDSTEPDPNPKQYTRWLIWCYEGVKAGNPDAVVGVGGLLGRSTWFIEGIYENGGGNYFDAVGIHPYADNAGEQGSIAFDWKMVEDYRAVMAAHGDEHKPMWCTEYGWTVERDGIDQQAEYLVRALDYMVYYPFITIGIQHVIADWHRGSGGLMGVCDVDLNPRPAYYAWARYLKAPASTPTPVPPTATPLPPHEELLANPSFEVEDIDRVPEGWSVVCGSPGMDPTKDIDGMIPEGEHGFAPRPRTGSYSVGKTMDFGAAHAWLYQRARVDEGDRLTASAWVRIKYTRLGGEARLGIDPSGGHNPSSERIVWTPWARNLGTHPDWFQIGFSEPVEVRGNKATLFLELQQRSTTGWNGIYFDDASLARLTGGEEEATEEGFRSE